MLMLVGLLFSAAIYPAIGGLLDPAHSDTGDTMMMSLYFALGVFLLIAVRNPTAHRSRIAFAAWSSFAHAVVMSILGFEIVGERVGFLVGSAVLAVTGIALIVLLRKSSQDCPRPRLPRNCRKISIALIDRRVVRENFDLAQELTTKGIQKFVADYQSTLRRSAL